MLCDVRDIFMWVFCLNRTGMEDECDTASEIYQCGRDADLPVMDQIYTTEKRNATIV